MLTIIPNPKAMNYEKLIDFLNKRKNIELNRFKQRGDENITKIEYRSTPVTRKWFNIPVDKTDYKEIRVTIDYEGQKDPSTKQLFGEE